MRNGDIFKEKLEYYKERFRTRKGLFDFFVGALIGGFVIANYNQQIISFFSGFSPFPGNIALAFGYWGLGLSLAPIWLGITFVLSRVFDTFFNVKRR